MVTSQPYRNTNKTEPYQHWEQSLEVGATETPKIDAESVLSWSAQMLVPQVQWLIFPGEPLVQNGTVNGIETYNRPTIIFWWTEQETECRINISLVSWLDIAYIWYMVYIYGIYLHADMVGVPKSPGLCQAAVQCSAPTAPETAEAVEDAPLVCSPTFVA